MCLISVIKIVQCPTLTDKGATRIKSTHNPLITFLNDRFKATDNYHYVGRFVEYRMDTMSASSWCQDNGAQFLTMLDIPALEEIV